MGKATKSSSKATRTGAVATGEKCGRVVEILKAVAHPVRLKLVALLCDGDQNVGELTEQLGLRQAIVSQQLRILRMSRLVEAHPDGGYVVYRLTEPHLKDLIGCLEKCCIEGAAN